MDMQMYMYLYIYILYIYIYIYMYLCVYVCANVQYITFGSPFWIVLEAPAEISGFGPKAYQVRGCQVESAHFGRPGWCNLT
jgi:hypothetical protein